MKMIWEVKKYLLGGYKGHSSEIRGLCLMKLSEFGKKLIALFLHNYLVLMTSNYLYYLYVVVVVVINVKWIKIL